MKKDRTARQQFAVLRPKILRLLEIYRDRPDVISKITGVIPKNQLEKLVKDWEKFETRLKKLSEMEKRAEKVMKAAIAAKSERVCDSFEVAETLVKVGLWGKKLELQKQNKLCISNNIFNPTSILIFNFNIYSNI